MNNLPFDDNIFDFVYSSLAIHYNETPEKTYNEVLAFYVGSPSMHFKLLRNANFDVLDFTESKCVEEAKTVDINYYTKYSEIPQFIAFLARK